MKNELLNLKKIRMECAKTVDENTLKAIDEIIGSLEEKINNRKILNISKKDLINTSFRVFIIVKWLIDEFSK